MAEPGGARNFLASVVGWIIVAIVAWLLFGFVVGTLGWLLRVVVIVVALLLLLNLYFRLKDTDPD